MASQRLPIVQNRGSEAMCAGVLCLPVSPKRQVEYGSRRGVHYVLVLESVLKIFFLLFFFSSLTLSFLQ